MINVNYCFENEVSFAFVKLFQSVEQFFNEFLFLCHIIP